MVPDTGEADCSPASGCRGGRRSAASPRRREHPSHGRRVPVGRGFGEEHTTGHGGAFQRHSNWDSFDVARREHHDDQLTRRDVATNARISEAIIDASCDRVDRIFETCNGYGNVLANQRKSLAAEIAIIIVERY
jgi:hypothetical protein